MDLIRGMSGARQACGVWCVQVEACLAQRQRCPIADCTYQGQQGRRNEQHPHTLPHLILIKANKAPAQLTVKQHLHSQRRIPLSAGAHTVKVTTALRAHLSRRLHSRVLHIQEYALLSVHNLTPSISIQLYPSSSGSVIHSLTHVTHTAYTGLNFSSIAHQGTSHSSPLNILYCTFV